MSSTSDQIIREEAVRAKDMVETGYSKLARCLFDIYNQNLYTKWEYVSFENYVDTELQINYRKAMYLVEIYNTAKMLNMDMARLERIGWTKARELIKIVDEENAEEWMGLAENSTAKELNVLIKQAKDVNDNSSKVTDEIPTITSITFKLGMVEHAIIRDALDESMRMINTDDLALALSAVCQEWLEQKGASPNNTTLEDYMAHGERIYGKKLVVSGIAGSEEEIEEIDEDVVDFALGSNDKEVDVELDELLR